MKSGSSGTDATDRGEEAAIIRTNELSLPANASVLYTGDLNSNPPKPSSPTSPRPDRARPSIPSASPPVSNIGASRPPISVIATTTNS